MAKCLNLGLFTHLEEAVGTIPWALVITFLQGRLRAAEQNLKRGPELSLAKTIIGFFSMCLSRQESYKLYKLLNM